METWLTFLSHFLELLHAIQYSHHSLVKFVVMQESGKWALGNITMNKASGGDGIPGELFQILKDDAVEVLNMPANLENSAVATGLENVSFHSNP